MKGYTYDPERTRFDEWKKDYDRVYNELLNIIIDNELTLKETTSILRTLSNNIETVVTNTATVDKYFPTERNTLIRGGYFYGDFN